MLKQKNVTIIGGGSGLKNLVRSLKKLENTNLNIIVTVADDGANSGTIRKHFDVPAVGDIRQIIGVLADDVELDNLINHRFRNKEGILENFAVGNILLLALLQMHNNNFVEAVSQLKNILNISGNLIPVSNENLVLKSIDKKGKIITGESNILKESCGSLKSVFYDKKPKTNKLAIDAIKKADYIILSIGSLFSSILSNVALPEVKNAISKNKKAKLIYIANLVEETGETEGFTLKDHILAIENHLNKRAVDIVLLNNKPFTKKVWAKYEKLGYKKVNYDTKLINNKSTKILKADILDNQSELIRHSGEKILKLLNKVF